MPSWHTVSEDDARRIVGECRKCLEEEAERLAPSKRMRMLAIQQAMETTLDLATGLNLKAINDQIHQIGKAVDDLPLAVVKAARRVDLSVTFEHRRSFFTSYISGKKADIEKRRFNFYVRVACKRLGLDYIAILAASADGKYTYYYLRPARDEVETTEPLLQWVVRLTAIVHESAALLANRGWGAEEVGQNYRMAKKIEEKLTAQDDAAIDQLRFEIAIGLWSHNLVRGKLDQANNEAATLREIAGRRDDQSMWVVALRASGTTALWLGRFADAERDLRNSLDELGDGSNYCPFASDLETSPFSLIASDLAAALMVMGRHKEALETKQSARKYLEGTTNPFHECYSLTFSSWIELELGKLANAASDADRLLRQASYYELTALKGLGTAFAGIIRAFLADHPKDGVGDVFRGLGEWQARGSALFVSWLFTEAAKVWLKAGEARQAEQALDQAFEAVEKASDGFYIAEMYRLRGDIQWMSHNRFSEAEADLRESLRITTAQQSRTFRLRAAMSLLRFARERNDLAPHRKSRGIAEQEKLLKAVYASFEHEPDSADLQVARSLITGSIAAPVLARPAGRKSEPRRRCGKHDGSS
jgi:tetratricopeptide (TPR) repeat protein